MIIYLDQNKWIDLAKAIVKPNENPKYVKVANLALDKVKDGSWVFPLSLFHILETTSRADPGSRKRLVELMVELSSSYSIKSFLDVQKDELINIFTDIHAPKKNIRIEAIVKNPLIAAGAESLSINFKKNIPEPIKKELTSFVSEIVNDEKIITSIMLDRYDTDSVNGLIEDDITLVQLMEKDRNRLLSFPKHQRYNIFIIERFWGLVKGLNINLPEITGKDKEGIIPKSILDDKNKVIELLEGAPSLNVSNKLTYDLLKNRDRPIKNHDNRDISFLSTAVPYCDIVITERTWKHSVKLNKLDYKYSTIVENDINYLLNHSK